MNRNCFNFRFIFTLAFLLIQNFILYSELPEELRKEVIVFIRPGFLVFPEQENSPLPLNNVVINSAELSDAFSIYGVQTIQKAFPDFEDGDTIRFTENGYQFLIPQFSRIFRLFLNSEQNADGLINTLNGISEQIVYAEKNSEAQLCQEVIPLDEFFLTRQWYLRNRRYGSLNKDIKASEGWAIFKGNSNIKVGIFDTGVLLNHPDLYPHVTGDNYNQTGDNELKQYHGTFVAGLIGAKPNNSIGISGVDWNCQLVSMKIFDGYNNFLGDVNAANKIIIATDSGVNIMNHSWGITLGQFSTTLQLAFVYAFKRNVLHVTAMGNIANNTPYPFYPANFQDLVLPVGATTINDQRADYSNFWSSIRVAAPGGVTSNPVCSTCIEGIFSSYKHAELYSHSSGTSFSAPLVSGLASLIKGKNPTLNNEDIKNIICLTADDVNGAQYPGWDQYLGYGRINCRRALEMVSSPYSISHQTTSGLFKTSTPDGSFTNFVPYGISGLNDGQTYLAHRYRIDARVPVPSTFSRVWGYSNAPNEGYNGSASKQYGVGYTKAYYSYNWAYLQNYIYDVWNMPPVYNYGKFPCAVGNVQFAYAMLGITRWRNYPITSEDRQQVGGCPWLFVQYDSDSTLFIGDNNLLKKSEIPENSGQDLTDLYKLNILPSLTNENQFSLKIIETENDFGYIDKVSFKAIDHPVGTKIGVTEYNQIVTYSTDAISSSNDAELNEEENITRYIRYNYHGNNEVTGLGSDSMSAANFDLGLPPAGDSLALIFEVSNNRLASVDEQVKDFAGEISMYANSNPMPTVKKFTRRENSSVIIIPIDASDAIVDSVIITWFRDYNLNYLFVAPITYSGYTISEIPLVSAIHTVDGEVNNKLSVIDGNYANIDSNNMLTLTYSNIAAPETGMIREYVFETTGRYEETLNSEGGDSPMLLRNNNVPYENKLFNNYPNPFNPLTKIKFSIKSNRWVKISIYDVLGKQVSVLVDQFKEKGEYDLVFNGSNLASGIYFYRIEAGDFIESKKMVVLK